MKPINLNNIQDNVSSFIFIIEKHTEDGAGAYFARIGHSVPINSAPLLFCPPRCVKPPHSHAITFSLTSTSLLNVCTAPLQLYSPWRISVSFFFPSVTFSILRIVIHDP